MILGAIVFLAFLAVAGFVLSIPFAWMRLSGLKRDLALVEGRLLTLDAALDSLRDRVAHFERSDVTASMPAVAPSAEPTVVEPLVLERLVVEPPVVEPIVVEPAVVEPIVAELPVTEPPVVEPTVVEPTVVEPIVVEPTSVSADPWEVVVGTSWLNKIGVSVFVLGLALMFGYSFAHVGPAGRIALGYLVSAGLLGLGAWFELRPRFRAYAYGLIAGGWAATYVTTYAMHGVDAARIIDNEVVAGGALTLVAGSIVAHSLRYRVESLSALAYVVAFGTLALTAAGGFSLAASVPLTVSLVVVSTRLAWDRMLVVGLVASFALVRLREVTGGLDDDVSPAMRCVLFGVFWLLFESADILRARVTPHDERRVPLFALNAACLGGALLFELRPEPGFQIALLASTGAAFLATSLVRRWLVPVASEESPSNATPVRLTTSHWAMVIAAALYAWLSHVRLGGTATALALLVETKMFLAAGLATRDRALRAIGAATMSAALYAIVMVSVTTAGVHRAWPWHMHHVTPVMVLAPILAYVNREWLRRRQVETFAIESAFTWAGILLVATVLVREVPLEHLGWAGLLVAIALAEASFRARSEYLPQSYLMSGMIVSTFIALVGPPTIRVAGTSAVYGGFVATALSYVLAARYAAYARRVDAKPDSDDGGSASACVMASAASALLLAIEWRIVPDTAVGGVWAATSFVLALVGGRWRITLFRWHGYLAAILAAAYLASSASMPVTTSWQLQTALAAAVLYALDAVGRRHGDRLSPAPALSWIATALLAFWIDRALPAEWVPAAWAATGAALVAAGFRYGRADQRWQGYALAAFAGAVTSHTLFEVGVTFGTTAVQGAIVSALLYAIPAAMRGRSGVDDAERTILAVLTLLGTNALLILEWRIVPPAFVAFSWIATGIVMLGVGLTRQSAQSLRALAYGVLFLAGGWIVWHSLIVSTHAAVMPSALGTAAILAAAIASRSWRSTAVGSMNAVEDRARSGLVVLAALAAAAITYRDAPAPYLVPLWGMVGLSFLAVGFFARERLVRLSGLGLLLASLVRLGYDVRHLDAFGRIVSFVVLGLVLLAVSWIYTRFKDQMREWL